MLHIERCKREKPEQSKDALNSPFICSASHKNALWIQSPILFPDITFHVCLTCTEELRDLIYFLLFQFYCGAGKN